MENYLQVENLTKSIGDLLLFSDISFTVDKGQKVALIARNGAGKTTLLHLIIGDDSPDSGKIVFHRDISVAFLDQNPEFNETASVIDHVLNNLQTDTANIIKKYEAMIDNPSPEIIEQMDAAKAWDYEVKIKQILTKLKIADLNQPTGQLSGGQKKRVALATALVNEPDLLLLDEPTNHLDLDMIEWLEEYLEKTNSTLLMVTHDRYFLDRVCNQIIELDDNTIYTYKGNYSYFLEKREERQEIQHANVEKSKNLMRKELDWIRRMPQARGTKAKYRIDAFEELSQKAKEKHEQRQVDFNIATSRLGKKILEIRDLSKGYDDKVLIKDFSYIFKRNEKIGIVGPNGIGKSTLLNILTGNTKPDTGDVEMGETIVTGYYKQDGIQFDETQKVIDLVQDIAEVVTLGDGKKLTASQFLNYFLFPNNVQHDYVYKLSGGEKRRLYLATVLMRSPNFLILDEPTNDLDIITINVFEDYLASFKGCVIIVSHDRYFMDKIVDHLFVFQGEGIIKDFPGNYTQFRDFTLSRQALASAEKKSKAEKQTPPPDQNQKVKKLSYKEKKEIEQLENEIETLENEKKEIEEQLSSGTLPMDILVEKSNRISEIMQSIDQKTNRWVELNDLK